MDKLNPFGVGRISVKIQHPLILLSVSGNLRQLSALKTKQSEASEAVSAAKAKLDAITKELSSLQASPVPVTVRILPLNLNNSNWYTNFFIS